MLQFTKPELEYIGEHLRWCLKNRHLTKMTAYNAAAVFDKINQMLHDHSTNVTIHALLSAAKELHSEDGEAPEYDRALVELVRDVTSLTREQVTKILT